MNKKIPVDPALGPSTVTVTIRIPTDIHGALVEISDLEMRSLNAQIVWYLKKSIEARDTKAKQSPR